MYLFYQIEQEKQAFYNEYLKNGFIIEPVNVDGEIILKMRINKK